MPKLKNSNATFLVIFKHCGLMAIELFFSEECKSRDGVAASSCAEGFGVCCVSE